ncbi:MAG: hypothetical protein KY441_08160, partial [Actinobacteria bacterium]|nr:hypothetical protein [Actinomycetota bacterium]
LRGALDPGDVVLPPVAGARPAPPRAAPGTRTFGPRPPRPAPPPAPSGRRPMRVLVLGALVATLAVTALVAGPVRRGLGGGNDTVPTTTSPCPSQIPPPVPPGAALLEGDLDGDGCPSFAVRRGDVLEVVVDPAEDQPRRYQLGRADDHLLLGDWDCDGVDTPGLYRPSTGEVFYFFEWSRDGAPLVQAETIDAGRRGATPSVSDNEGSGCQEILLRGGQVS